MPNEDAKSSRLDRAPDPARQLHADVDRAAKRLHVLHAARLQCHRGCSACCVDDLTVFEVEAALIRAHHAELLAEGIAHAEGACAFLDADGACRVYAERPYVCRTQGLPLRWIEDRDDADAAPTEDRPTAELRDICPLNEAGPPIEELHADDCWTIGPFEERLAGLQRAPTRVRLRDLFARHGR